jgi:hypothetical protein
MKKLTILILLCATSNSWGQNPKKLLTKTQLDSVNHGQVIYFKVSGLHCKYFENFQGTTKVRKIKGKVYFDFVNESIRFSKDGKLSDKFTYDQFGHIMTYQSFNSNGQVDYDCSYETKEMKGGSYRLENCKAYYEPTILWRESYRYVKQTDIGGHLTYSKNKKYGVWKYYDTKGRPPQTKDFGEIE